MSDPSLIIQPAGHNTLQTWKNFEHTVLKPVPIEIIRLHAGDQVANALEAIYPSGSVPTWGLEPHNQKKVWDRIRVGDSVLFVGDKKAFMSATISYEPLHSRALALALWGLNEKNRQTTWEYVYFIDDLHDQNVSYEKLSHLVGYGAKNNFMSATVRSYGQSKAAFERLGLESETYLPPASADELYKITFDTSFVADREVKGTARGEQRAFRHFLFGVNSRAKCAICLKVYPVQFLITAHIKKREACTYEEKLDSNIVVPMCVFGCDALYEHGYIGVDPSTKKVIIAENFNLPEVVHAYLVSIKGNDCSYLNEKTMAYFEHHMEQMVHTFS